MKTGVSITIIYTDEHLLELRVKGTNGFFAGQADLYEDSEAIKQFASILRGFPANHSDVRKFELGTFDVGLAGGGAGFKFYCVNSVGHAVVEVRLRTDDRQGTGITDIASFHISVEAAAVDSFVGELEQMSIVIGQTANLEAAV